MPSTLKKTVKYLCQTPFRIFCAGVKPLRRLRRENSCKSTEKSNKGSTSFATPNISGKTPQFQPHDARSKEEEMQPYTTIQNR